MQRVDRSLLLQHDTETDGPPAVESIKDVDWRHQSYAMQHGYKSMLELAVDELLQLVTDLRDRVTRLEGGN